MQLQTKAQEKLVKTRKTVNSTKFRKKMPKVIFSNQLIQSPELKKLSFSSFHLYFRYFEFEVCFGELSVQINNTFFYECTNVNNSRLKLQNWLRKLGLIYVKMFPELVLREHTRRVLYIGQ